MIVYKAVGALILCGSGFWVSRLLNARLDAAVRQTNGFLVLLQTVKRQVDCYAQALPDILFACEEALLRDCGFCGTERPRDWEQLLLACRVYDGESVETVRRFAADFGKGYREEQLRACDYTLSLLESRRAHLTEALPAEKKRNTTLCLSASLGVAILLF